MKAMPPSLGQGDAHLLPGHRLHDGGDHGYVHGEGGLLPPAVLHHRGLEGDVGGDALRGGVARHQQVLAEGAGGLGEKVCHKATSFHWISGPAGGGAGWYFRQDTRRRRICQASDGEIVLCRLEQARVVIAGDVFVQAGPTRSLWPILPRTRPSGEVMPSTAQTEPLGLPAMSRVGTPSVVHVLGGDLPVLRQPRQQRPAGRGTAPPRGRWAR